MAAEVNEVDNNSELPFMCGICHEQHKTIEQFDLHLQSHNIHISEQLHTCLDTDNEINKDRFIHCKLCSNRFKTLCTFHDHLTKCGGSGSYIFHYQTFQAYPLSELCAYFESREVLQTESRDQINDEIELHQCKKVLKDYMDALNDLFYRERNIARKSDHNVCNTATQTLSIEDNETRLVNMPIQTSDSEGSYNFRKGTKSKYLTAQTSKAKPLTRTRAKPKKSADKRKGKRGRKRKEVDKDFVIPKKYKTYSQSMENQALILIKTECSDTEEQTQIYNVENIIEIPSYTLRNEIKESKDEVDVYDSYQMDHEGCVQAGLINTQDKIEKSVDLKRSDKLMLEAGEDQLESLKETSSEPPMFEDKTKPPEEDKKEKGVIECDVCGRTFLQKFRLIEHKKCHSDVKDFKCDMCSKRFKHKRHMMYHRTRKHGIIHEDRKEKDVVECDVCGKTFIHRSTLIKHKKCHSNVRMFNCDMCHKRFKHKSHMLYHKKTIHGIVIEKRKPKDSESSAESKKKSKPRPRTLYGRSACDVCGLVFMKSRLRDHVLIHSDVRAYSCDICSKTFKYPKHLRVHKRSHDKVLPYCCELCGQGFFNTTTFKCHILWHKDSSERPYKCEVCGKGFITKNKLERHMVTHTGEMKEQCDLCGRMFNQKSNMVTHMSRVHKKEMKLQCPKCGKKFYTNIQLHNHMIRHADPVKNINSNDNEVEDKTKGQEEDGVYDNGEPELEKSNDDTDSNPST